MTLFHIHRRRRAFLAGLAIGIGVSLATPAFASGPGAKQDYDKSGKGGEMSKLMGDKCLPTVKPRT